MEAKECQGLRIHCVVTMVPDFLGSFTESMPMSCPLSLNTFNALASQVTYSHYLMGMYWQMLLKEWLRSIKIESVLLFFCLLVLFCFLSFTGYNTSTECARS